MAFNHPSTGQPPPRPAKSTNLYLSLPPKGASWVSAFLAQGTRQTGVYLRLGKGSFGDAAWARLLEQSDEINRELGESVEWGEGDTAYYISLKTPLKDLKDSTECERVKRLLAEKLMLFAGVFRPRLESIEKSI